MDAIDSVLMNSRLHYLGMAARTVEPSLKLAVLTCMDARVDVSGLLGLRPGDAHVIRNAGGRVTDDVLRSLVISQAILNTREIMLIHHTDCALGRMTQAQIAERITAATGQFVTEDLGTFSDPIQSILQDMERLKEAPRLAHRDKIRGFMYDLQANNLKEIVA
jgi:carbonic anhydrase